MDWKSIISDLAESGWTQEAIAREVEKSQAWVSHLGMGLIKEATWHDGERLRKLHKRVMSRRQRAINGSLHA